MHQIQFLLGLRLDPAGGAYSAPQPLSWIKRGRRKNGRGWKGRIEEGRGRQGKE